MFISVIIVLCIIYAVDGFNNQIHRLFNARPRYARNSDSKLSMIFGRSSSSNQNSKVVVKVDGKTIESDQKSVNLRRLLIDNNVDVYPLKAKVLGNCGGAGICGTCAVKVIDGIQNFNPPSKNELKTLNGKPADIRLSCCSKISGPVTIKTKP
jgi:ferredoxin